FVGTFNVSGQSATESLAPWLVCEYDIDELDLSPEAYILSDSTREEDWCRAVTQGLGDKAEDYWK
ncbi:1837_t:CDS:2, partial [Entrophospora sp. SA101]